MTPEESEKLTTELLAQADKFIQEGDTESAGDLITQALDRMKIDHDTIKPLIWNKHTPTQ